MSKAEYRRIIGTSRRNGFGHTPRSELRRSREQDADSGLWNGQIQRASAAYSAFDHYGDEPHGRGPRSQVDRFTERTGAQPSGDHKQMMKSAGWMRIND